MKQKLRPVQSGMVKCDDCGAELRNSEVTSHQHVTGHVWFSAIARIGKKAER